MCVSSQLWHHAEGEEALLYANGHQQTVCLCLCVCMRETGPAFQQQDKKTKTINASYGAAFTRTQCLSGESPHPLPH